MIKRNKTRKIRVGSVFVGGNEDISVQSMTNTKTDDVRSTVLQIRKLECSGCEIVRVAVPKKSAALAIKSIRDKVSIPIVADVHFDYKLAIESVKAGVDGLRFNPGNIGNKKNVQSLVSCAKDFGISIRVGVNAGSLEKNILEKYNGITPIGMVESALGHVKILQDMDFNDVKISVKASNVQKTVEAYRLLSRSSDFPLHIGITEAGTLNGGVVKSAIGIGILLNDGIGDTIRVSLTEDPIEEVHIGLQILRSLSIRDSGPEIISCPTCGRCEISMFDIIKKVKDEMNSKKIPIKIAIMGCVVNGPGEARDADIGVAGGKGFGILFRNGKVIKKIPEKYLVNALLKEIKLFEKQYKI